MCPHGRLQLAFDKPTCPEKIGFQASSATILVTFKADFRGNEIFVVHRLGVCVSPSSLHSCVNLEWCDKLGGVQAVPLRGAQGCAHSRAGYGGTSLIMNSPLVGPYSRTMPRALWKCQGRSGFL